MAGTRIFKTPQMTTAQRNALVLPPDGSQIFNTDVGEVQITNDNGVTWQTVKAGGIGSPAQMLYVSQDGNDTTGVGTIERPYATYEKARTIAVAAPATSALPYAINILGFFSVTGGMTISPFVSVVGNGVHSTIMSFSTSISLDASWSTVAGASAQISNLSLGASFSASLVLTLVNNASLIFDTVNFVGLSNISSQGSGLGAAPDFYFVNCQKYGSQTTPNFSSTDANLYLINSHAHNITTTNTTAANNCTLTMTDCPQQLGTLTIIAQSAALMICYQKNSVKPAVIIDGTTAFLVTDVNSSQAAPSYLNGANNAINVSAISLSDSLQANVNFTPVNYSPVASANYKAASVTGNLAGIDAALAAGGGTLQDAYTGGNGIITTTAAKPVLLNGADSRLVANTIQSNAATDIAINTPSPASGVNGTAVNITTPDGSGASATAGAIVATVGASAGNANGGAVTITAGASPALGTGGTASLVGGASGANGGLVAVRGGAVGNSATGGAVIVAGGAGGTTASGGNVFLRGGLVVAGTNGKVAQDVGDFEVLQNMLYTTTITTTATVPTPRVKILSNNPIAVGSILKATTTPFQVDELQPADLDGTPIIGVAATAAGAGGVEIEVYGLRVVPCIANGVITSGDPIEKSGAVAGRVVSGLGADGTMGSAISNAAGAGSTVLVALKMNEVF